MPHAPTFTQFKPSVAEAKLYEEEWEQSLEYRHYLTLENVFNNNNYSANAFRQRCTELNRAYHCLMFVPYANVIQHLQNIPNLVIRLNEADLTLVDEIANINGNIRFVFATMFCNHSNKKYYGYSRPIGEMLVRLNNRDNFYKQTFDIGHLHLYEFFFDVMNAFVAFYGLHELSTTQLDVMLKGAYNLY